MNETNPVADLLAAMIYDTCWGNPWHRLATAVEDLADEDLGYRPMPKLKTPGAILGHAIACARNYGNGLAPRTDDAAEQAWDDLGRWTSRPASDLASTLDTAYRRLHARARSLTDGQVAEPAGIWRGVARGFVLMDGGILHAVWHGGQVAMLCNWRRCAEAGAMTVPSGRAGKKETRALRDWSDWHVATRKEACLRLLHASYQESPWHSLRRHVLPMSAAELAWSPFEPVWGPMIAIHVAHCKVIYADQAFGTGKLGWGDCDRVVGAPGEKPDGERLVCILDRAHAFLLEHVQAATDEQIERTYPMHHGVPHTGWQVCSAMAQHDAWHAGQIALMRDVYRALK